MKMTSENVWPPGVRFHPTDEELVLYYLKRKICNQTIKMNVIAVIDVYKWDPEELPGLSLLKTGDRQWFFFSPRDRKYPNAARSNRATRQGYWKATGKDRNITCNSRNVGVKKTLVFYKGRAPNGERTDWVMHEYTLDEEELKRCRNMQGYYVLYKVFKKSGPGPKNGEQYGAPFKEEEWADDEDLDAKKTIEQEIPARQQDEVAAIDHVRPVNQVPSALDDIEEFMKELADEPLPLGQQISFAYEAPQVVGEEEAQSTLVNLSSKEVMFSEPIGVCNERASFDFTPSAAANLQLYEASEVTCAPKNCEPALQFCEEDFLEMDDLIGPEPIISADEKPVENLWFDEFDGLSDLDLFHDAAMLLPVNEESITNVLGNNMINHVDHQFQFQSGVNPTVQFQPSLVVNQMDHELQPNLVVNQMNHHLQPNLMVNQADYGLQTHSFGAEMVGSQLGMQDLDAEHINSQLWMQGIGAEHINSQPWMHDQLINVHTPAISNQGISYPPSAGLVHQPTNRPTEANENQSGQEGGGTTSWISSSLWSFVESIPTTPASASESPLVYRALERMSSFSRLRINAGNTNVVDGRDGTVARSQASSNRGFVLFSIFGALCALLWMFMGPMRVLWRSISS